MSLVTSGHDFSLWAPLGGGALIGLAASLLLLTHGRVAGISGLVGGLLSRGSSRLDHRVWFVAGLLSAGVALLALWPEAFASVEAPVPSSWLLAIAGLLVGHGTSLGNGCTSGHGVCGLSRGSRRSLVATLTFMTTGALTVLVVRHLNATGTP